MFRSGKCPKRCTRIVDLAASFVWPSVTYVDVDRRAGQFLGDESGVQQLLVEHDADPGRHLVRFIGADYTEPLGLGDGEFDLLISLYARRLDAYLIPKRDVAVTKEYLQASGRGVAYTRSPFAHLFERVA